MQWETGTGPFREGGVEWKEEHLSGLPAVREAKGRIAVRSQNAPVTLYL